jgi:hypothetical protein
MSGAIDKRNIRFSGGPRIRLMSGVDMKHYSEPAVERTMKNQEVILRAMAQDDHVAAGASSVRWAGITPP